MYSQKPLIRRVNLLQLSDIIGGDNANYDFSKSTLIGEFIYFEF